MLIAALIMWLNTLLGGGADAAVQFLSAARDLASDCIVDRGNRKAADEVFDRLEALHKDIGQRREEARKAVSKEMSTRDGNPRPALDLLATDATAFDLRLVELRFKLRDTMTRDEWQRVFPAPVAPATSR